MAEVVVMPQLGNTVESCLITTWHVKTGDTVEANTVLCGIETDKSAMDVPAGVSGVVLAQLAEVGDEVPVKEPFVIIGAAGEDISALLADLGQTAPAVAESVPAPEAVEAVPEPVLALGPVVDAVPEPEPTVVADSTPPGPPPAVVPPPPPPEPAAAASEVVAPPAPPVAAAPAEQPWSGAPKSASPRARELAAVYGVAIDSLTGTGPRGRIIERDVMAAVSGTGAPAAPPPAPVSEPVAVVEPEPLVEPELPAESAPAEQPALAETPVEIAEPSVEAKPEPAEPGPVETPAAAAEPATAGEPAAAAETESVLTPEPALAVEPELAAVNTSSDSPTSPASPATAIEPTVELALAGVDSVTADVASATPSAVSPETGVGPTSALSPAPEPSPASPPSPAEETAEVVDTTPTSPVSPSLPAAPFAPRWAVPATEAELAHWLTRGAKVAEPSVDAVSAEGTGIGGRLTRADLGVAPPPVDTSRPAESTDSAATADSPLSPTSGSAATPVPVASPVAPAPRRVVDVTPAGPERVPSPSPSPVEVAATVPSPAAPPPAPVPAVPAPAPVVAAPASVVAGSARPVSDTGPIDDPDFPGPVRVTPLRGIRKLVATRMLASMAAHAQLTFDTSAPAANLLNLRRRLKQSDPSLGMSGVTVGDLVAFAAVQVARKYPSINATLTEGVLSTYTEVHLGLAVDTARGLLVPTIRHASRMHLRQFAAQTKDLAAQARSGGIHPDLLAGATFTVTNLGSYGIENFTPILNSPQTAILGVNTILPRPFIRPDGSYGVEQRIGFSLTVDHAVVDGADAARYLADLVILVTDIDIAVLD
jgi:pyruvate/2-oxoglutarate dehydrogenase complex dihydrolipoamide acyltransferase (E2) component